MEIENKRILIADDNKDIHDDIKYILETSSGYMEDYQETKLLKEELFGESRQSPANKAVIDIKYDIDDAYQGNEAIEMVSRAREAGEPYSLIFMDVRMPPGMDGIETIEKIWEIDRDVGVVICTAYSDYSWDQIISKLGHKDNLLFIRKPFDNVSLKQIALAMTTKWSLKMQVKKHIGTLEQEVDKRTMELKLTVEKLRDEIVLREEKEKLLAYSAHYDSLTELLNRRSFSDSVKSLIDEEPSRCRSFSLFYLDLDDFKSVNDIYGHDIGDQLLIKVSERIGRMLDEHACYVPDYVSEHGKVKAIFRLGGDEFTAVVNETDRRAVGKIAQSLIDSISEPYIISGHEVDVSCCIGISIYKGKDTPINTLLKYADIALYEAKKVHSTYRFHELSESYSYINEKRIERELKKAIARNQIDVYMQSLVNTRDEVIGMQSLIRWLHPEYGELEPGRFLHIAQKSDQIIVLGAYVIRKSLEYLKRIHESGHDKLFVMVSCTSREFYHPGFVDSIKSAVNEAGIAPSYLKLNLEDKFTFQTTPGALAIIRELNEFGVQFALNGFDSDYPAFVFLQQVPKDTMIKLNRAYVKNIATDTKNQKFLMALMDIIETWELDVIISGIETQEQKSILDSRECILQGYHFNTPKPIDQYLKDLAAGE
ncbi:MAG: EAL domain-containing protein [Clostridiaceae bacterium]|nr:EAL domain-containing protein [Clostridiaceae bacterium]